MNYLEVEKKWKPAFVYPLGNGTWSFNSNKLSIKQNDRFQTSQIWNCQTECLIKMAPSILVFHVYCCHLFLMVCHTQAQYIALHHFKSWGIYSFPLFISSSCREEGTFLPFHHFLRCHRGAHSVGEVGQVLPPPKDGKPWRGHVWSYELVQWLKLKFGMLEIWWRINQSIRFKCFRFKSWI